jgi:Transposase IS66 family
VPKTNPSANAALATTGSHVATNNVAERAVRALIGARKNWGGNRTQNGARAQAVLTSILQTAKQQGKNPFAIVVELLCCGGKQKILDLVPPTPETPRDSWHDPPPQIVVPEIIYAQSVPGLAVAA